MLVAVILSGLLVSSINGQRIAGGDRAEIQDYPFAAALITNYGEGSSYSYGCGGTILRTNVILSAASCFYNGSDAHPSSWWRARVGSTYSNAGGTIYAINLITPHPDFSPTSLANDIALLRTTLAIALVPGSVQVARISGGAYTFAVNQQVQAIGWGSTSNQVGSSPELRAVQIWTVEQTTCANRWNASGFTVTANMVCAGWLDVGVRGQCDGDAGSPLLDVNDKFVTGVFSKSDNCAEGWLPGINTRLAPYVRWIASVAY